MEAEGGYGGPCVLPSLLNSAFRVPSLRGVAEMGEKGENEVDENEVDEAGALMGLPVTRAGEEAGGKAGGKAGKEEDAVDTKGVTAKNDDDERPNDASSCLCGMGHRVPCLVHGPTDRLKAAVAQNSVDGSPTSGLGLGSDSGWGLGLGSALRRVHWPTV